MVLDTIWQKLIVSVLIASISILSQLETLEDTLVVEKNVALGKPPVQVFDYVTNLEEYSVVSNFNKIIFLFEIITLFLIVVSKCSKNSSNSK